MVVPDNGNKGVVVVVPVYKAAPVEDELRYFQHNMAVLKTYQVILVAPEGLDLSAYKTHREIRSEYFSPNFFKGLEGYNRLMLSKEFYKRFSSFEYMLICQLDAFIFKDSLKEWCRKDYDYVGAPWVNKPLFLFLYVLVKTGLKNSLRLLLTRNIMKAVGNGGLSLRKIKTFIESDNKNVPRNTWKANEDIYWSFFARRSNGGFITKPKASEAALFSIEIAPAALMKKQNYELPMGIHAWERYKPGFWNAPIQLALGESGY